MEKMIAAFKERPDAFEPIHQYLYDNFRVNPLQIKEILDEVCEISEQREEYELSRGWIYALLSWHYHDNAQYETALTYCNQATELFRKHHDKKGLLFIANAIMANYTVMGIFEEAINWGYKGILLAEELRDEYYRHVLLHNIANSFIMIGMYDEAREVYNQILEDESQTKSIEGKIISKQLIAEIELNCHRYKEALHHIDEAIVLSKSDGYEFMDSENLRIRGEVYSALGNSFEAEQDYIEGLRCVKKLNHAEMEARLLIKYGKLLTVQGRVKEGEAHLREAIALSKEVKSTILLSENHQVLSDNYKRQGKFEQSLEMLELHLRYRKEIYTKQINIGINKIRESNLKREAEEYRTKYDQMAVISKIGQKITSNLNIAEISNTIYTEAEKMMGIDVFGIATYCDTDKMLDYEMFIEQGKALDNLRISIDDPSSLGAVCVREQQDIFINDIQHEYKDYVTSVKKRFIPNTPTPAALLFCPLIVKERTIGFVTIQSYQKNAYTQREFKTLKILSVYIAIALENAKLFGKLVYSAKHDFLTGTLNRAEIVSLGERMYEEKSMSTVAMLDLDHFKHINDTYGHQVGDLFLQQFVLKVHDVVGKDGSLGRYGGEEFLLIMNTMAQQDTRVLVEKIRVAIEGMEIYHKDFAIKTTVSIGVCSCNQESDSFTEVVNKADEALYIAKKRGRNRVVMF